ncbi:ATP-dependent Clp protease ATP-binding subunit ClpX [Nitrococcus mobilis]|uniref:ATP-dependent protease ATP-binding subunit n=1 Tax=Nitrococcus mobilis Nb-231 TaxID=314278 RepID=A4BMQ0_9GAMM|nr:ATP-dependent Clp protease ATP-binding subunit ClpX [Nitrococcus mobilis]EAR23588.1 ATP-dependent protease ATP-binding subunit [Nitrococcus mobilis Nb-231]
MGRKARDGTLSRNLEGRLMCSFCMRPEAATGALIAGPDAYICEACVFECSRILARETPAQWLSAVTDLPRPRELHDFLDQYVIGQEHAKKVLSVAVYNHYKRIGCCSALGDPELGKSNILLIGPSGSGKTLLAETLARRLAVPFLIADATALTETGYVGEDVDGLIRRLVQSCDNDAQRASLGIVYLDEVDKLAVRHTVSRSRDVSGEGVQQALLRFMDSSVVRFAPRERGAARRPEWLEVDTRQILFICGGAFEGLAQLVERRRRGHGIGFTVDLPGPRRCSNFLAYAEADDLIHYGLIPEFVGRLPVVSVLDPLDEDALVRVLTEPANALVRQYTKLLAMDGCELHFTRGALHALAQEALARGTGARGLRTVIERVLLEPMYRLPRQREVQCLTIDERAVRDGGSPSGFEYSCSTRA